MSTSNANVVRLPSFSSEEERAKHYFQSESFKIMFQTGMTLIEETANYLDGEGREESSKLNGATKLAYASEAARLTSHLMIVASWLLRHRSFGEGEGSIEMLQRETLKLPLKQLSDWSTGNDGLPSKLADLIARGKEVARQVGNLQRGLFSKVEG